MHAPQVDAGRFHCKASLVLSKITSDTAENLFLRKQLGRYIERKTKPRRASDSVRFTLARLSRFFDWRNALTIVKFDNTEDALPISTGKRFL
jgi:hypothetical protein